MDINDLNCFLKNFATPLHFIQCAREMFLGEGFKELYLNDEWVEIPTKGFVIHPNGAMIAYKYNSLESATMLVSHCDHPYISISSKGFVLSNGYQQSKIIQNNYINKLSLFQRPLKIVGYIFLREGNFAKKVIFDSEEAVSFLPYPLEIDSDGYGQNPIIGLKNSSDLESYIAKKINVDIEKILDYKLSFVEHQKPSIFSGNNIVASNNLSCIISTYAAMRSFLSAEPKDHGMSIFCFLNNNNNNIFSSNDAEGIQGHFLSSFIERVICENFDEFIKKSLIYKVDGVHINDLKKINHEQIVINTNKNQNDSVFEKIDKIFKKLNKSFQTIEMDESAGGIIIENVGSPIVNVGFPVFSKNFSREYCLLNSVFDLISFLTNAIQ